MKLIQWSFYNQLTIIQITFLLIIINLKKPLSITTSLSHKCSTLGKGKKGLPYNSN